MAVVLELLGFDYFNYPTASNPKRNQTHLQYEFYSRLGRTHLVAEVTFSCCVLLKNQYPGSLVERISRIIFGTIYLVRGLPMMFARSKGHCCNERTSFWPLGQIFRVVCSRISNPHLFLDWREMGLDVG